MGLTKGMKLLPVVQLALPPHHISRFSLSHIVFLPVLSHVSSAVQAAPLQSQQNPLAVTIVYNTGCDWMSLRLSTGSGVVEA